MRIERAVMKNAHSGEPDMEREQPSKVEDSVVISLKDVSKFYKLYRSPKDRLKEALHPGKKSYHEDFYALKRINLEVRKGEILGIVGKNGCGKSTLLKVIAGVMTANSGSVSVKGTISALLELGSGFNPEYSGMQNIFFYGTILGFSKREMENKIDEILDFAEIGDFIFQPLKTYSSGMKSRLGFAVAVHIDPDILILDEVLSVGDALFQRKCYAKMNAFFESGKTVIYVSHDANSVNQYCTRAILLDRGEKIVDSDTKTVTSSYQRLLFSKQENQEETRKDILAGRLVVEKKAIAKEKVADKVSANNSYYISDLRSTTLSITKNYDVNITDPHIVDEDGNRVNVLVIDQTYRYRFGVAFGESFSKISLGVQIKDIKGMKISGITLLNEEKDFSAQEGETYEVELKFVCRLLCGTYYTNSAVTAVLADKIVVLNKWVDALVFKVQAEKLSPYGGIVHLNQELSYKVTS